MTDIHIEGGEILASREDRTITGLLIPYNELGATNVGRFMVEAGVIDIPADPAVVSLNLDHDRYKPVGRATRIWEEPTGIMATFLLGNTPDADAALEDALSPQGKRRRLSAEFLTGIKDAKATGGPLAAGALVEKGAFPSAQVLAADTPDATAPPLADETPDPEHVDLAVDVLPEDITATTPDGASAVYTPDAALAQDAPINTEGVTVTASAGAPVPSLIVPPAEQTAPLEPVLATDRIPSPQEVFTAISAYRATRDPGAYQVLAALQDIIVSGTNPLTGSGVIQPNWVGKLNQGQPYVREYVTLGKLGTEISIGGKKGYKMKRGTSGSPLDQFDGTWAGNKAAVNSYRGFSLTAASTTRNFAIAEDIAREFYDLPGGAEYVEAFIDLIVEDYYRQTDDWANADWITAAGAPVAPATAKYSDQYPEALGMVLQGILAVKKKKADGRRDVPSFSIVNEEAYEDLVYAAGGEDNLPAFVSISISTASKGTVDGNVQIVQGDTGIDDTPSALTGAGYAIEFDELPGGPLQVDALAIANGGIDKAVHGYLQTFVVRSEAVVLVGTADTP